mmetsp:Transcript_38376/g.85443  ORF Transcript_38376/g.85443 Transcript_38376/m.85443 type:complete len:214 (-) Transcript_38376:1487-2128(-)
MQVELEQLHTALDVREGHCNLAVKAAGALEGGVERLRQVGGSHDDDPVVRLKSIHLHQQLVQGLARVVLPVLPVATNGVNLVNEDDAGRLLLGSLEQRPHAPRPHSYVQLLKLGSRPVEEGHTRLARHRPGNEGLASTGWAGQQHPLGQFGTQARKLGGILQELHHLLELLLGLVTALDVLEGADALLGQLLLLVLLGLYCRGASTAQAAYSC